MEATIINVKKRKLNDYDYFVEEQMSDGRFILTNVYNGENGIFNQSVIDMLSNDDDSFERECSKYFWKGES